MPRSMCALAIAVLLGAGPVPRLQAQEWASRFPRSPLCDAQWHRDTVSAGPGVYATLIVRPVFNGDTIVLAHAQGDLVPLHPDGQDISALRRQYASSHGIEFDSVPGGRYTLQVRFVGAVRDLDTIEVRTGRQDTVTLSLFAHLDPSANCRPHRFRRPGERACVTQDTEPMIDYARSFADPERTRAFHLLPFRSADVRLVSKESTCERAGLAYDSTSPPRRVIVLDLGREYFVFDPFEPLMAGEWTTACFFDRHWRPLTCPSF